MSAELKSLLISCSGFDWDECNDNKNWLKHKVHRLEAEQVFFNQPLVVVGDEKHSQMERRFLALGRTNEERLLAIVFTIRKNTLVRVISARDMHRKERVFYEKNQKEE